VTTAADVQGAGNALFAQGFQEFVANIPMPQTADLVALQVQAAAGNTSFVGTTVGNAGSATTRIEFVAIDLNVDGQVNGANEGFFKIYQCTLANTTCASYVVADVPTVGMDDTRNCGHLHAGGVFVDAFAHPNENNADSWEDALKSASRRCYLGGSDSLFGAFQAVDPRPSAGRWLLWPGAVSPLVAGRPDGAYLFPITRELNPNFKGVIYVQGRVALSGVLRGKVTVAATEDIIIVDDLTYATNPGAGTCNDMLGLFGGTDIIVSDNTIQAPQQPTGGTYYTYDDTRDEVINGVLLALNIFTVENYNAGASNAESCQGTAWGRGCLLLTGGIIQQQRGAVGTTGGTGNLKRYSYDQCAYTDPPPYFPTTGIFTRGRYYEVNPVGFDVAALYQSLTPN